MPPLRPHWFRGKDVLFPGSLVPLTLAALLWSRTTGTEERLGVLLALALQAGVAVSVLGAVGIYVGTLWRRRALLRGFKYIRGPFYAVMINSGSYAGALEPELVIGQFYRAFETWQRAFGWSAVRDFAGGALFWVWLKPNLVGSCGHGDKMNLPGFSVARAHKIVVRKVTVGPGVLRNMRVLIERLSSREMSIFEQSEFKVLVDWAFAHPQEAAA